MLTRTEIGLAAALVAGIFVAFLAANYTVRTLTVEVEQAGGLKAAIMEIWEGRGN